MTGKFALDLTLEGKEKETREEEVRKEVEKAIAYTLDYSSHPTKPGETAPFMYAKWRPDGRMVRLPRCSLFLCPPSFARASCAATGSWRPCPSSTRRIRADCSWRLSDAPPAGAFIVSNQAVSYAAKSVLPSLTVYPHKGGARAADNYTNGTKHLDQNGDLVFCAPKPLALCGVAERLGHRAMAQPRTRCHLSYQEGHLPLPCDVGGGH